MKSISTQTYHYKYCLFIIIFFTRQLFAQPTITNFSPVSGPVGTIVSIHGTNFSEAQNDNVVYFGAVKGRVVNATTTTLLVEVPVGATYKPVTVTTSNLTAYSKKPFNVTFTKDSLIISNSLFSQQQVISSSPGPHDITLADFNNDGKPDVLIPNYNAATISVLQNTTNGGVVSFAPKTDYATGQGSGNASVADLDGDGRLDIAVTNYGASTISIFRNISSASEILFESKIDVATESLPTGIAISDLDDDGKPDIAVACFNAKTLSVYRNSTTGYTISFEDKKDYATEYNPAGVAIGDLDGDGKPEIVVANRNSTSDKLVHTVSVFKNISTATMSFAAKIDFPTGIHPNNIALADMDLDGKLDIIISNNHRDGSISILRNGSSLSDISFYPKRDYAPGNSEVSHSIADIDGDGLPDIVTTSQGSNMVSIFKNVSTSGNIELSNKTDYYANSQSPYAVAVGDLNGDANPDIALANFGYGSNDVTVMINQVDKTIISSFSPGNGGKGTTVTITGRNFAGATSVTFGGMPAQSFTIVSSTTITAVVGSQISGQISVITPNGTAVSNSWFQYVPAPVITSFTPVSGTTGTQIQITGTDVWGATEVRFGGTKAASFTMDFYNKITAIVGNGSSGDITITTAGGTATKTGFVFTGPTISSFEPKFAGSGTEVTIRGTKFTGATQVTFGEAPARAITVVDSATIIAIVDTGSSGGVVVTTPVGKGELAGFVYTGPTIESFFPLRGGTGTTVKISGKNLDGVTEVLFGGVPAVSFNIVSATQINAVTEAGQSGSITVKTPRGISTRPGFTFIGVPIVTDFMPKNTGPATVVTITGENFSDVSSVSFGGVPALSFTNPTSTSIKAVVGVGASGSIKIQTIGGTTEVPGFSLFNPPVITSFTPLSGKTGATVHITGSNFNPVAQKNIVRFGAVRATVSAATSTNLTVLVPVGATYEPITVQTNNLIAYSAISFKVVLDSSTNVFLLSSFAESEDFSDGVYARSISAKDLNDDGKIDLAVGASVPSIHQSQSTKGHFSFAPKISLSGMAAGYSIATADFDGDGRIDVAVADIGGGVISVFKATGTGNAILFDGKKDFPCGGAPISIATADFDGDGKTDIAVTNESSETLSILRNTSISADITFDKKVDFTAGGATYALSIADLNGDTKPDVALINFDSRTLSVYKNNSTPGLISFQLKGDYLTNNEPVGLTTGDLNNDGRPDLIVSNRYDGNISVYKNLSVNGTMVFGEKKNFIAENEPQGIAVGDLDGDGWLDIAVAHPAYSSSISLYKNLGQTTNVEFSQPINYAAGRLPSFISIADMDGDGKPDIVSANDAYERPIISIFRNQIGEPSRVELCAGGGTTITSNLPGNTFQWQLNTGNGFQNLTDNNRYTGTHTANLQLTNMPSSTYGYQYRCIVDGKNSYVFETIFTNTWTGSWDYPWSNASFWSCGKVPDANTDVIIKSGSAIITSDASCRSLKVSKNASVKIDAGIKLTITH